VDTRRIIEIVEDLEPVDLKGVELLRELRSRPNVWFPTDRAVSAIPKEQIAEATIQMVTYVRASRETARRLDDLTPIPLAAPTPEYPL
jgi:hypothetical protein